MQNRSKREDYRQRITRVVEYIHNHLDDQLNVEKLAEVACFSPYHWHRIYHAMTGETATQTLRRLRHHRAAGELIHGDKSIAEIAKRAGYGSVEAFTRSFRNAYQMPPATFRETRKELYLEHPFTKGIGMTYDVEVRNFDPVRLAAISHQGPYVEIGAAFEKLIVWAASNNLLSESIRMIGVYYDDPAEVPQPDLQSDAGFVVDRDFQPDDITHLVEISGGPHAILLHKGPYVELHKAYHWLYGEWLPNSPHEAADRPPFEEYLNDPKTTAPSDLLTNICIPIKG